MPTARTAIYITPATLGRWLQQIRCALVEDDMGRPNTYWRTASSKPFSVPRVEAVDDAVLVQRLDGRRELMYPQQLALDLVEHVLVNLYGYSGIGISITPDNPNGKLKLTLQRKQ